MKTIRFAAAGLFVALLAGMFFVAAPQANADDWYQGNWNGQNAVARWRGSVDDTANIYIQGGRIWAERTSGKGVHTDENRTFSTLPNGPSRVFILRAEGRGRIFVFQQPRRDNNYTAGIRIEDPQPGRGQYRFVLSFEPRDHDWDQPGNGDRAWGDQGGYNNP